ncbi:MAG: cofactor-independent phosphoglycerate mutase [Planctomycetota bacterium]|jgi:2,3-bisphosphoglycerate-independent phosphoglycerate mutase
MKYLLIIPDGFADRPLEILKGRTPIEAAVTPNMDALAAGAQLGLSSNIPRGMASGSDVACMSLMGYDPKQYHTGRAPLEAVSLGVELGENEAAFRANLVTATDGIMVDYSAGHIKSGEAELLIGVLGEALADEPVRIYPGVSYRNLLVTDRIDSLGARTVPPHDFTGRPLEGHWPKGKGADFLRGLMERSHEVLRAHEVNEVRLSLGENPANMIWLWGGGTRPQLPGFEEVWGLSGAMITAVDLLRSIGILAGFEILRVPGATGYLDTDYAAKGAAAAGALEGADLVVVHVEAPDEAGHGGKALAKLKSLERIDEEIVGPLSRLAAERGDVRVMIAADHATPVEVRTHTDEPVPFLLWGPGVEPNGAESFSEAEARRTRLKERRGHRLMSRLLGREPG